MAPLLPVTLPETEIHTIHSKHADACYQLWVAQPIPGMRPLPEGPRSVLYVLDANLFFGTAVEMTRIMHQLYGELPPLLVVGIAYDTPDPTVQSELRSRDFTPTEDSGFGAMVQSMPGAPEPTLPADRRLGRAPQFLDFLADEVKPFIEAHYSVAAEGSTLWGASLGGLFVLYALLQRPNVFDAYIATSPAIWWNGDLVLRMEEAFAEHSEDLATKLVLAVGGEEERPEIPMLAAFKMVTNVGRMAERLRSRNYPSLELSSLVLEGESHTSVVPVALTRGLRSVHGRLGNTP